GSRMSQVNVARLHDDNREALSLAWIAGRDGATAVRSDAAAAAALIGHLNLTHPNSIQVIVADGVTPPPVLVEAAKKAHTPLLASPLPAPKVIEKLSRYLAKALADKI